MGEVSFHFTRTAFVERQRMEDLPQHAHVVVRKSNLKISHRRLTDYREFKKLRRQLQQKRSLSTRFARLLHVIYTSCPRGFHFSDVFRYTTTWND